MANGRSREELATAIVIVGDVVRALETTPADDIDPASMARVRLVAELVAPDLLGTLSPGGPGTRGACERLLSRLIQLAGP